MSRFVCYHVTTREGFVYGVAATSKRDALFMVQARLAGEGSADVPLRAERVAMWGAPYGTVLAY